ncbi:hypothetical protein [Alteromonas ponticola]|uniref:Uncharacterized protein n=1 Tax=Alteromonas ponticola TaxID=2720613 RepID=A0ABX1R1V0_9ALTE|nr:hypothetical protein [Alteromonas ponticola]NMH59442.1 hypothetical protein [Alteromonas ponticola]
MSAVKLLEKLGGSANVTKAEARKYFSESFSEHSTNKPEKLWCIMFPEKEEDNDDDKNKEEEKSVSFH